MGRILIVDDSELMRKKLAFIFEQENHEIVGQAENGLEAIKLFKDKKPDLITMDLTMPVMDGIEAIKEIIQIDPLATIVVCSAMGQQKIIRSEEHTSELQSRGQLVCRLLLEKTNSTKNGRTHSRR